MTQVSDPAKEAIRERAQQFRLNRAETEKGIHDYAALVQMTETEGWAVLEQSLKQRLAQTLNKCATEEDASKLRIEQGMAKALREFLNLPALSRSQLAALQSQLEDNEAEKADWVETGGGC